MRKKTLITPIKLSLIALLLLITAILFTGCTTSSNTSVGTSGTTTYISTVTTTNQGTETTEPDETETPKTDSGNVTESPAETTVTEVITTDVSTETTVISTESTTAESTKPEATIAPEITTGEIETTATENTTAVAETSATIPDTTDIQVITSSPVETTKNAPDTNIPIVTTQVPIITTSPVVTTNKPIPSTDPVVTTKKPATTTSPAVATKSPVTTTSPVVTTKKPATTTSPVVTTKTPVTTTSPVVTTKKPVTTTSPIVTTSAPETTTAPVETRKAPDFENPYAYSSLLAYNNLDNYQNSVAMKQLYNQISSAAVDFTHGNKDCTTVLQCNIGGTHYLNEVLSDSEDFSIAFEVIVPGLEVDDIITVWAAFKQDNPFYYWMPSTVTIYSYQSTTVYMPILIYNKYAKASVRNDLNKKIISECKDVYKDLAVKSDYTTALNIHNLICKNIDYKYVDEAQTIADNSDTSHSVLGYFDRKDGVCECYAKTFQLFMNLFDIDCYFVLNTEHAFNLLQIEDSWYWVDVTHDDLSATVTLTVYFCKNDTENIWTGSGYKKPTSHTDNTFLGSPSHAILPSGDCSYIYEGYSYKDWGLFFIIELPARSATPYSLK